jgi:hypothetical protein
MSLNTRSKFYYGHTITESNNKISFYEGVSELIAQVSQGSYSLEDFATEVSSALSLAGTQEYTCIVDRVTRKITISASSSFDLLISTGSSVGESAFPLIGFSGSDQTSSNSYEGNLASGSEYIPQFILQKYVDFDDNVSANKSNVFESASGIVQSVSFGQKKIMECNIMFATDINQGINGPVETNLTGVSDLRNFMLYLITKGNIEFIPNRDDPGTFTKCFLDKTSSSQDGTGFTLEEMYSKGLANYFETKTLTFRKVD